MRARAAQGNPGVVQAVMSQLSKVVEEDIEPFDAIEPETRQLFNELKAPNRMAAGG